MARLDADALKQGWFDFRRKRFWAWVLLASYALFGFVVAPLIVRSVIVSQVHSLLGLEATLEDVDINPFALTVRLEKFSLADPKGAPLIAFDEVDINAQLSSIVNRALTLSEFRIVHPFVRVERDAESRIEPQGAGPAGRPEREARAGIAAAASDHCDAQSSTAVASPSSIAADASHTRPNSGHSTCRLRTSTRYRTAKVINAWWCRRDSAAISSGPAR